METSQTTTTEEQLSVTVHPLVLLSVVDHYNRVARDTKKRVVGVLLGQKYKNTVDVTNSFAIPFEEDLRDPSVWFLDHNYLAEMWWMFKRVNTGDNIVGFYSSGPRIKENDLAIEALFRRFTPQPVFVIVDVRTDIEGLPTTAYRAVEEVEREGDKITTVFKHLPSTIGASEPEQVGVEHLLRDVNDPTTSTLANQLREKIRSLGTLHERIFEMRQYLEHVTEGRMPINHTISYNIQTIFNLVPSLESDVFRSALLEETNDIHLAIYISTLVRCITSLHDLVNNKITFRDLDDVLDSLAREKATQEQKEEEEQQQQEGTSVSG
jgi:26S proteasome regulatory subunit N8